LPAERRCDLRHFSHGSIACQIAKIIGATVIGSAGGTEKCAFLKEIGVDHVIDYKAESDLKAALASVARWH
jgi:NADPH-dependent curcumin reductase CurA